MLITSRKGFEPPTVRLEGACSIQLSYRDMMTQKQAKIMLSHMNNFINLFFLNA